MQILRADRGVDGTRHPEVVLVPAVDRTDVQVPVAQGAPHAGGERHIVDAGLLVGHETVRIDRVRIAFVKVDEVGDDEVPRRIARPQTFPVVVPEPVGAARAPLPSRDSTEGIELRVSHREAGVEEEGPAR